MAERYTHREQANPLGIICDLVDVIVELHVCG